jgi:putative peptidoglycan lipid II flippase
VTVASGGAQAEPGFGGAEHPPRGTAGAQAEPGLGAAEHRPRVPERVVAGGRIAGAAALIAVLTMASRLVGFARIFVFSRSVGATELGDVYQAANTVPNIIFEIVAGGALAALVVPLLAGAIARADREATSTMASALLTWVLAVLVPLAAVVAAAAYPIMWLLKHNASPEALSTGAAMLRVFAPQLPLYGVGIVLTGVLQAHHRFAWPVLAPLLSSLTVIGAYLAFFWTQPGTRDINDIGTGGQLILSVGTTLGVVVLSLCLVIPVRRLGLRWRPTLRVPVAQRSHLRSLALVGGLTVLAQQLALAAAIVVVQWHTVTGSLVLFTQAQTVYLVPWAVLAVPVATSVYPVLARAYATGDGGLYQRTLAGASRSVLLLSGLGTAALLALARPVALLVARITGGGPSVATLAAAIAGFAPGLLGYGLFALHSRALYARGRNSSVALATLVGWGGVTVASVALALALPVRYRVPAVTVGNSIGMLVLGGVLLLLVARRAGRPALRGLTRTGLATLAAGALAALAGIAVRLPMPSTPGVSGAIGQGMLSGAVVVAVFAGTALAVDRRAARPMIDRLVRRRVGADQGGV